ncbi:MAG TPA: hypothetical protein VGL53_10560 [Bryobacteraceae bacterium]
MHRFAFWSVLAAAVFSKPALALAILVNGVCYVGNCAAPDQLVLGQTISTPFDFVVTMSDGDAYRINGTLSSTRTADGITSTGFRNITFIGNNAPGNFAPTKFPDSFSIQFLQDNAAPTKTSLRLESEQGNFTFSNQNVPRTTAAFDRSINGVLLPRIGPFSPPSGGGSANVLVLFEAGKSFLVNSVYFYTFASGTQLGASITENGMPPVSAGSTGSSGGAGSLCVTSGAGSGTGTGGCTVYVCSDASASAPGNQQTARAKSVKKRDSSSPSGELQGVSPGCTTFSLDPYGTGLLGDSSSGPVFDPGEGTDTGYSFNVRNAEDKIAVMFYEVNGVNEMELSIIQNMSKEGQANRAGGRSRNTTDSTSDDSGTGVVEILSPLQAAAATYTAAPVCYDVLTSPCWLTVPNSSGSIAANSRAGITAMINTQGFDPGVYTGAVVTTIIPTDAGQPAVTVTNQVRMVVNPAGPALQLSQSGLLFQIAQGAGVPAAQTIFVRNLDPTSQLTFSTATSGETWLSVSQPAGPATSDAPVPVSVQVDPTGLAPGNYTSRIDFSGPSATNGTQSLTVAFTVLPANASTGLTVSSAAMVFVAPADGSNPPVQSLTISNPSNQTLTVSTSSAFLSAGNWLSTYASGNVAAAGKPLSQYVSVNAAGLDPGTHLAVLNINAAETNTTTPVEVMLIVQPASCTPGQLSPWFTNLEGGFTRAAGVPVPIDVLVVDSCGAPVTSGSVAVYFPATRDTSIALTHVGQGHWAGTWLPHLLTGGAADVGVVAVSGELTGSSGVIGTLIANASAVVISPEGVVNSASLLASPIAPGSLITISGMNLAAGLDAAPTDGSPYPRVLSGGGTQVFINGEAMPLVTAAPGSISAVVPYDVPVAATQQLIVFGNGGYSLPQRVVVSAAEPAVFSQDGSGTGAGVVQEIQADGSEVLNTPATPSTAGDSIAIYGVGLGAVSPLQMAGTAVGAAQTTAAVNPVTVTIGGQPAVVSFAGLSPVMIGWYEVDVTVPPGITPGASVPVVVSVGGVASVPVTMAVQ